MAERSRSRAYPVLPLQEAIDLLDRLQRDLGWGRRSRDAIAQSLGYANGKSGIAARKIAALVHFGLLSLRDGDYSPTSLARQLLEDHEETRYRTSLREACLNPSLFQEIIHRYEPVGRVPHKLAEVLVLDYKIQKNVREEVAQIFLTSTRFAGILDAKGVFCDAYFEESARPRPLPRVQPFSSPAPEPPVRKAETEEAEERQELKFSLTYGKRAEIYVPAQLNERDIALLKKQIEYLESQVQFNRQEQPVRLDVVRNARKQDQ